MVWSLTPFFEELDVLEIRLATLDDVVDRHVICESHWTHRGNPKGLVLPQHWERFKPWAKKIIYVTAEDMPDTNWGRERYQRVCLWAGFDGDPDDLVILSDLDEIPHPDAVRAADPPQVLPCRMHVYRLNWRWRDCPSDGWQVCRILRAGDIIDIFGGDLDKVRNTHPENGRPDAPFGWHLTCMGDIARKVEEFAHEELWTDEEHILRAREFGEDIYNRQIPTEWVTLRNLPPYVKENRKRFEHMLVKKPRAEVAA